MLRGGGSMRLGSRQYLSLSPGELAFLGASLLIWTAYTVWLGKDTSWDFRNYHWYIPYALLNGRMGIDIAVAHQGSYYNPLSDVPFYLLARYTTSWFAIAVLGLFQAANIIPMYLMARSSLKTADRELAAAALSFFGMTGGMMLTLYGTHYYDNVLSVFTLTGLAIVVVRREELANGAPGRIAKWCALGGFLTGCAAGLKFPMAPFAMGFAAALIAVGGGRKQLVTRLVAGGLGGVAGFVAPIAVAVSLLAGTPHPSRTEIVRGMDGNVCRCGTYPRIVRAIQRAAAGGGASFPALEEVRP